MKQLESLEDKRLECYCYLWQSWGFVALRLRHWWKRRRSTTGINTVSSGQEAAKAVNEMKKMSVCVCVRLGWHNVLQCYCGGKSEECTGCSPRVHFVGGLFLIPVKLRTKMVGFRSCWWVGYLGSVKYPISSGSWIMYRMQ